MHWEAVLVSYRHLVKSLISPISLLKILFFRGFSPIASLSLSRKASELIGFVGAPDGLGRDLGVSLFDNVSLEYGPSE